MIRAGLALSAATVALALPLAATAQTAAPPTQAEVKSCIQEVDPSGKWSWSWKSVDIAPGRQPNNNYEATGHPDRNFTGYPVHAVYSFNGFETIDAVYFMNRNANGHWQIPFICVLN